MARDRSILVMGIGSPILGDDGVGIHAIRAMKNHERLCSLPSLELGTAGLSLLDFVEDHTCLILIDAMRTGSRPGTVCRLRGEEVSCCVHAGSGHDADLASVLAMGEKLKGTLMPREVHVIAVEAADLSLFSESLTPHVEAAIPHVLELIEEIVEAG